MVNLVPCLFLSRFSSYTIYILAIIKDLGVRSMISIPGSLSLFCQVGDDVIRPCKICGGCQIRVPRSIHSINIVPYNLDSNLYKECVLSTSNASSYLVIPFTLLNALWWSELAILIVRFFFFVDPQRWSLQSLWRHKVRWPRQAVQLYRWTLELTAGTASACLTPAL